MGGPLTAERYDDTNRATCEKCKHSGKAGDWQRIGDLRALAERVVPVALAKPAAPVAVPVRLTVRDPALAELAEVQAWLRDCEAAIGRAYERHRNELLAFGSTTIGGGALPSYAPPEPEWRKRHVREILRRNGLAPRTEWPA